jgi:DNA-binding LytR/AlgR family response regulator
MNELQEFIFDKKTQVNLISFLKQYGIHGLEQALKAYINCQQEYICKNKTSISKINIYDIYYLEIQKHNITIYTTNGTYKKYGSLNNELKFLSHYNFIKCNQSCIVSLKKIKTICNNYIILTNNTKIHMSRNYASKVILSFFCISSL